MMMDKVAIGDHEFETIVAITDEEQQRGLMFVKWPPPVMSFPVVTAQVRQFWMKNTQVPLDIVFCRDNVVVAICEGEPYSTKMVGPRCPTDLVVELPHGTVDACGIQPGDSVRLKLSRETLTRRAKHLMTGIFGSKGENLARSI